LNLRPSGYEIAVIQNLDFFDSSRIFKYLISNNLARGISVANRPQKHHKAQPTPAKLPQSLVPHFDLLGPFSKMDLLGAHLRSGHLERNRVSAKVFDKQLRLVLMRHLKLVIMPHLKLVITQCRRQMKN
jgi:hypothetical protein